MSTAKKIRGFTLIELLVVIGIIAVLGIVVILTLNPSELLKQSRDAARFDDLAKLQTALSIFQADISGSSIGAASTTYLSTFDTTATSSAGDQCQGLSLQTLVSGWSYHCPASSTYENVDGSGWLPANLRLLSYGSPLSSLPTDPVNTSSSGFFYTYTTDGRQFQLTAIAESQKQKLVLTANPSLAIYPGVLAEGNNLTLSPLWNQTGLIGWWKLDEGSGLSTADATGITGAATIVGAGGWTSNSKTGAAYRNSGASVGYVLTPATGNLTAYSVGGWFFIDFTVNQRALISASSTNKFRLYWYANGGIPLATGDGISLPVYIAASSNGFSASWHHFFVTSDGTNASTFVDGVKVVSGANPYAFNDRFMFGSLVDTGGGYTQQYTGNIDDLRLYNRALSPAEVMALYNSGR